MSGKTLLVCGGRDYDDRDFLYLNLTSAWVHGGISSIICGYNPQDKRYQGADQLAYEWAAENQIPCQTFPADWRTFGRSAGPRRNTQMADAKPDECAAFPRKDGSWGSGTLDMLRKCAAADIQIHRIVKEPTRG